MAELEDDDNDEVTRAALAVDNAASEQLTTQNGRQ